MLVDIHSHKLPIDGDEELRFVVGRHSLGIHPWELKAPFDEKKYLKQFEIMKTKLDSNILAIGECGLDRRREGIAAIEDQIVVLKWHINWAKEERRPIIIHCVKAYSDLLNILKENHFAGKILLHDFGANKEVAQSFLHYDCYFSFGQSLFRDNSNALELIRFLPIDKIFLETDDQVKFNIKEIYQRAQSLLELDQKKLEMQLEKNLVRFFSDLDNVSASDIINNLSFGR